MPKFVIEVIVDTDTQEHAAHIARERLGEDTEYGFPYRMSAIRVRPMVRRIVGRQLVDHKE